MRSESSRPIGQTHIAAYEWYDTQSNVIRYKYNEFIGEDNMRCSRHHKKLKKQEKSEKIEKIIILKRKACRHIKITSTMDFLIPY